MSQFILSIPLVLLFSAALAGAIPKENWGLALLVFSVLLAIKDIRSEK